MKKTLGLALVLLASSALAQTWTTKQPMPDGRHRHRAEAGVDPLGTKRIYVFSGGSDSQAYSSVHGYNPLTNTWATFANIPTPRVMAASANLNGTIYVVGGINTGFSNGLNTVEAYQPSTNTWSSIAPLPVTTSESAAAAANGKVYVFGGYQPNINNTLMSTYEFTPPSTWTQKANMPGPARTIGAARACNGKIYVIGYNVNYEYNPNTNTWATKAVAPTTQLGRGVVIGSDQRIYLINDRNYNTSSDPVVYYYRFTNNTWYQAPNNIRGYTSLAAAHLDRKLYVTGGTVRFGPYTDNLEQSSTLANCTCWGNMIACTIDAVIKNVATAIHLTELKPGGGAVLEHANATQASVAWAPLRSVEGTRLTVTGQGLVNDDPEHATGSVTFSQEGRGVRVLGDFSALDAFSWRLEAYERGRLVAEAQGDGPLAALTASGWPVAAGPTKGRGGEASLAASFGEPTLIQAAGIEAMADEIRIISQSGVTFAHVDSVRLSVDKLNEIIITAVTTTPSDE
jgi:N-acetylneuraminic acid mutarotase